MNLLATRRFLPLFITQFLGAFNDNFFKNALVMIIAFKASRSSADAQMLIILAGALFMLPYFLFSALAGQFADKLDRAQMARITKIWEIIIVLISAGGFLGHHDVFLLIVLFGLGVQATFFGPIKYALLPQHLTDDELVSGNALIEAGSFLAILLGTIGGGLLVMQDNGETLIIIAMLVIAITGYIASRFIPAAPGPSPMLKPNYNIATSTWNIVQHDRKNPRVFRCIMAISWFWVVGAIFLSQFPTLVKDIIGGSDEVVTLFLAMFSVGIGCGSFLSSALVKGKIDSRFVPIAAFGMALFSVDLAIACSGFVHAVSDTPVGVYAFTQSWGNIRILADLFMIALCGGVFVVPLYAIMQHDSDPDSRARTIATNNVINAFFMVASAVLVMGIFAAGFTMAQLFMAIGAGNIVVGIYANKLRKR